MNNYFLDDFVKAFREVQSRGFVKTNRSGNTGIGKTLEDYMNIPENNIDAPDLHGFEIKSQRASTGSYVTLFTRAPSNPKSANTMLREKFGTPDKRCPEMRVLHTSMFHNKFNSHKSGYGFRLACNDNSKKVYLEVEESNSGKIVNNEVYWAYEVLDKIITNKLQNLAFIAAETKISQDGVELFYFKHCTLFHGLTLERLIELIKSDTVMFDIRIGVYRQGKNAGKTHDHGSGFRIKKGDMPKLFDRNIII